MIINLIHNNDDSLDNIKHQKTSNLRVLDSTTSTVYPYALNDDSS